MHEKRYTEIHVKTESNHRLSAQGFDPKNLFHDIVIACLLLYQ